MNGLAAQFGPGLLVASLAAPLVVLALFFARRLPGLARAITPLTAVPAFAAAVLAIGGVPFGAETLARKVREALDARRAA